MTNHDKMQGTEGASKRNDRGTATRRDYLRTVGVAGAIGVLSTAGAGAATAQSDDWESEADRRIAEHRQGRLEVQVVDGNGQPIPNADVDVEMQEHDFGFGTAVGATIVTGTDSDVSQEDAEEYRSVVPELFNTAVLGNHHKWRFFEENQDIADEATAWLLDQGLRMRGHVCIWGSVDAWSVPGDVVDAMGVDHESGNTGPDLDPAHVEQRSLDHIERIISHYDDFEYDGTYYGSVIDQWDVVNEVVHQQGLIEAVDGENVDGVEAPILAEWYRQATEVAPDDVALDVNDYNTLEGPYQYARDAYHRQIEFLNDSSGARLDGVGLQSHFSEDEALTPDETLSTLDEYAAHGVDVRITEFDAADENWADEAQGEFLYQFMKTTFSHEAVTDFVIWGPWDGSHWRDDAPLFYEDWTPKPGYDAYTDLVFDQWWTSDAGTTDDSGTYATDAFLGVHEVTITAGGESTTEQVSVTDASGTTDLVVTLGTSTNDCEDQGGVQVGDHCARDPDDDGLYEDVNGDGQTTHGDVNAFFENLDSDDIQGNADAFDFDGNGRIGFSDVISLLRDI
ncbi:endo-1,4-beta-xylanase [Natrinema salaciae]|uniref:endo-1,4-beta-xylanase n=1 Tax=Natrinema salaciae TaxID=1186196 RepID=A0A1H9K3D0_9EURY|nr:endo-1,4-beta-xylanase [Natrinema salaciae]SEQ93721.1 Endo-1,4-beta-xylanase, GH35 family [Natrinema salaciae]